ncbi:hypothetical protein DRE_00819 [Drechslerella stenobrocha 248]|uniref:Uncharacterized protein n=1 Tax=Drechslerella stenobrocha 248 TaxID=1043628 RepID=W7I8Q6_9PEZI|nr:hypothetical protein DRE_00819 [Drechslerella stenobrocha 248]
MPSVLRRLSSRRHLDDAAATGREQQQQPANSPPVRKPSKLRRLRARLTGSSINLTPVAPPKTTAVPPVPPIPLIYRQDRHPRPVDVPEPTPPSSLGTERRSWSPSLQSTPTRGRSMSRAETPVNPRSGSASPASFHTAPRSPSRLSARSLVFSDAADEPVSSTAFWESVDRRDAHSIVSDNEEEEEEQEGEAQAPHQTACQRIRSERFKRPKNNVALEVIDTQLQAPQFVFPDTADYKVDGDGNEDDDIMCTLPGKYCRSIEEAEDHGYEYNSSIQVDARPVFNTLHTDTVDLTESNMLVDDTEKEGADGGGWPYWRQIEQLRRVVVGALSEAAEWQTDWTRGVD